MPDYSERNVFGVPVSVTERRHGQPLSQCVLYAMRHLRRSAGVTVGMFRKPGVKMRVQTLRIALETDPGKCLYFGATLLLLMLSVGHYNINSR